MFSLLTQSSIPIIGWCAKILGFIMRYLYIFLSNIGIANIGVAIILFTLIVKIIMFPMTLKQQKFSKLSGLMNPEIQAIQKKYRNKRDNESLIKMQEETKAVYAKYGTSPSGSCLQLLIQMPILLSLYYVISGIPAYVPEVKEIYQPISTVIAENYDDFHYMEEAYQMYITNDDEKKPEYIVALEKVNKTFEKNTENKMIDVLARLQNDGWKDLDTVFNNGGKIIDDLGTISNENWSNMRSGLETEDEKKSFDVFLEKVKNGSEAAAAEYKKDLEIIDEKHSELNKINSFATFNLSQSPATLMGFALIIPVLSALTQWLSAYLMQKAQGQANIDNPMSSTMKSMNIIMPLISAVFCFQMPTGLGIYWVCSALFQAIQQVILNAYFEKVDVNDIIKKNVEKQKKKKPSMTSRIMEAANENARNIEAQRQANIKKNANTSNTNVNRKGTPKPGSMAAKANMVKSYNEKHKK